MEVLAFAHYLAGRYEAAYGLGSTWAEADEYLQLRAIRAAALGQLGRIEDARRQMRHV